MESLKRSWQSRIAELDAQVSELEQNGAAAEAIAMRYYRQAMSDCLQDLEGEPKAEKPKASPTCWTEYGASIRGN